MTHRDKPNPLDEDLSVVIEGHSYGCRCVGCRKKRGTYTHPKVERGEDLFTERHQLTLSPRQKGWVMDHGGNEYLRALVNSDMLDKF